MKRPKRTPRRRPNPPPRRGALVEVERREAGYFYRHPMGHLAGPYGTAAKARTEGAMALAAALHPGAPRSELYALADALLTEDPARPYARQFSDGWRVWDPARRLFLGAAGGGAFATRGEAEAKRRALAGEDLDDGPMFRRVAPAPAVDAQLGLFGARANPSGKGRVKGWFNFRLATGGFDDGKASHYGQPWLYVDVVDERGRPLTGGVAVTDFRRVGDERRGPAWIFETNAAPEAFDNDAWHRGTGRLFADARWENDDPQSGRLVVSSRRAKAPRANPAPLGSLRGGAGELVTYRALADGRVLVRASVAGAGTSENDMEREAAERHRARLLRLGYRANPARPKAARHRLSPRRAAPRRRSRSR